MSPTKRVGESDPNRGTTPEAITPGRYKGHVAIVTGAGSGIGRATARRLAAEGAAVACLDLAEDAISAVAAEINQEAAEAGGRAIALRCDVTDEALVAAAVAQIDGGARPDHQLVQYRRHRRLRPHARAVTERLGQDHRGRPDRDVPDVPEVLPGMIEHGGAIVNTVSTAGMIGQPYSAAYCASKGGVRLLTMALAVEYMARGVRVDGVAPVGSTRRPSITSGRPRIPTGAASSA